MDKKERLKSIIKGVAPKSTFGTDPNDPWSTKAGINENEILNKYFISKGLNPKTASKVSKISASKTGEFERWKQRRIRGGRLPEEVELEEGNALLNAYLKSRGINPEHVDTKQKIAYTKGNQFQAWLKSHVSGGRLDMRSAKYREGGLPEEVELEENHMGDMPSHVKGSEHVTHRRKQELDQRKHKHSIIPVAGPGLRKEECSKSAQMIKDIYKKKIKEDLNDWEKEDKSVQTYGKKPNHDKADKKDSMGEKKPQASAVVSGGTTLTGEPRDTIEIDPMMRVRPGQPDPTKDKDKKDDKKQENKKDK